MRFRGFVGAQILLVDRVIPTALDKQTVFASRSAATKQSTWIATARFAHLAMTHVQKMKDAGLGVAVAAVT
jgi:hypothetical protein